MLMSGLQNDSLPFVLEFNIYHELYLRKTPTGAVSEEFQSFKQSESAQEVLSVVEAAEWHSLVEFRSPPRDLREFVREAPTPTNRSGTLEFANTYLYSIA